MRKLVFILLFPLGGMAQGIHFEQNLSWQQVQFKAKTEHKYIFMDCYATWCVPCKQMSQDIFIQKEAGDQVNENFISVSVQMDSTAKDDEYTKSWYADAKQLMKKYQVSSFPTYLFFDPDGHIIHRAGGSMPLTAFISITEDALNPGKQFYPLMAKYEQGQRDSATLSRLILSAANTGDQELIQKLTTDYISSVKNIYTKDNLDFIGQLTKSSKDKGFELWFKETIKVDAVKGTDYAERKLMNVVMNEDGNVIAANRKAVEGLKIIATMGDQPIYEGADKNAKQPITPDWNKMYTAIKSKYGAYYADRISKWVKMSYYHTRQDWRNYDRALITYLDMYKETVKPSQLNDYAWSVFAHSFDKKQLGAAVGWIKVSIALSREDPDLNKYIDTYANLLYKTGNRQEAINWEQKALQLGTEQGKQEYAEILRKMQNGEKTWE